MRYILPIGICLAFLACSTKKAEQPKITPLQPRYYFYPRANVYFDSANMDFIFQGNDGQTWQTETQIPAAMQALLDKNIRIDSPSTPVWKDNENHRLLFSALLYTSPSDTQEIKKPAVLPPPKDTVEKKKERKGLRKFFDKIFNRKKRKEEKQ